MPLRSATMGIMLALTVGLVDCTAQQSASQPASSCRVSRISDGDSFRCQDGRRVRLIGIDTPESRQQPFGDKSRLALQKLVPLGTHVRLEADVAKADRYGRQLAYVWMGPTLVNEAMVREGWAVLYTVPPNVKYVVRLGRAQKEARARGAGLWSEHGFECLPSDFRQNRCASPP
jgi:micrococcal nuclease